MTRTPLPPRGGAAGLLLLFCAAAGAAGLAFDIGVNGQTTAWIAAQPGARAAIGAGAALIAVAFGHGVRLLLSRRESGGGDAGDHS